MTNNIANQITLVLSGIFLVACSSPTETETTAVSDSVSCHQGLESPLSKYKREASAGQTEVAQGELKSTEGMVLIPAGEFPMGATDEKLALPREYPVHKVKVNAFYMDVHEVTNREYRAFTDATGYITVAERPVLWEELKQQLPPDAVKPADSLLQPGSLVFTPTDGPVPLNDNSYWWRWVIGANWRHPLGPKSDLKGKEDHPVVHLTYEDAQAYAKWVGKRLPTEAEWEWAARGGKKNTVYPWGNEHVEAGKPKCNYWTGKFPYQNTEADGYVLTAPVMMYPPNPYGLYDLSGNVWEICSDWYDDHYYEKIREEVSVNPTGPSKSYDSTNPYQIAHVIRGGSFLCSDSYCASYRVSARMPLATDSGLNHVGFRCVADVK